MSQKSQCWLVCQDILILCLLYFNHVSNLTDERFPVIHSIPEMGCSEQEEYYVMAD